MEDKIKVGITADASQATAEVLKLNKTQQALTASTQAANEAMKASRQQAGDVNAYERLNTAIAQTRGEVDHTRKSLEALSAKQKETTRLTDAETLSLQTNRNSLQHLNEKKAQGIKLSLQEENRLIRAQAAVSKLTEKQNSHYQLTKREQAEVKKLTARLTQLESKESQQVKTLGNLNDRLSTAGLNTNNLSTARAVANRRAEKAAQLLERENRLMARSNELQARKKAALESLPDARVAGAGVAAGAALAGRASARNETAFVDVAKTLYDNDEIKGEEAQTLRKSLNRLAQDMSGAGDVDVMRIAAGGANGGVAKEDLLAYTRDTLMTKAAWDMQADEAAEKSMALRNSMNYSAGEEGQTQFMNMANMINDVANKNGGVKAKDLLGVMSRTGALMVNSGFTEAQALALSGSLLSKGASEEEAATASKNITGALTAGFAATTSQKEILSMLGMDAQSTAESMQTDAMGTLMDVLIGIQGLEASDQSAAIKTLFGDEANAHVQKLLKDTAALRKMQSEAANASSDSVRKEYEAVSATSTANYEQTADAFNRLGVAVGDRLLPMLEPVRAGITAATSGLADFVENNEGVSQGMIGLVGAMGAFVAARKVIAGFKFARNLAGIARESAALRQQSNATVNAARSADRLTRAMNTFSRSADSQSRRRGSARSGRDAPSRRRRRGGFLAAGVGLAAGTFSLPSFAGEAADMVGAASDATEGLNIAKAAKAAAVLRPLAIGLDAVNMAGALASGDTRQAAETGGGLAGGLGGAAAGAAIGTMILPGIGTAIGAGIGGLVGDEVGTALVSSIYDWFADENAVPDKTEDVKKAQEKMAAAKMAAPVTFAPQLTVEGTSDPEKTAEITLEKMQTLFAEFLRERGMDADDLTQNLNHSLVM